MEGVLPHPYKDMRMFITYNNPTQQEQGQAPQQNQEQ